MKFSDVDWCGLLVDQLKECKQGWDSTDPNSPFTGPLATLTLLYVDRASCPGLAVDYNVYPITYWTAKRLKEREKQEIINEGFGKGWLKCLSITWDKDDQPSVKDRVQVVETNIDEILKYKKRVEDVLGQLCVEHPEDFDVLTLKARYATPLHDKPMWIRDAEASQQIKEVLGGLNDEKRDSAVGRSSEAFVDAGCSSPAITQYHNKRKTRSSTVCNNEVGIENKEIENAELDSPVVVSQYRRSLARSDFREKGTPKKPMGSPLALWVPSVTLPQSTSVATNSRNKVMYMHLGSS